MSTTVTEAIRKTVLVDFPPEQAFDLFTRRIFKWWPVQTHSYGGDEVTDVIFESEVGGRVYEVTDKGEQDWGRVLEFAPPHRFLLEWLIGEASGTEVEVTFEPEGPGSRVVLEHRGFVAVDPRGRYDSGWAVVLGTFVESASKKA
jgi:uncharacterized protein YndB with AHSA1/START domain